MTDSDSPLFRIDNLDVYYGVIHALRSVSLHVSSGELVCLVGANGAGKTTLLKSIVNLVPSRSGSIHFAGKDIRSLPTHTLAAQGLSLIPEGRGIFPAMTVRENLQMGTYLRSDTPEIESDFDRIFEWFPVLHERQNQWAGTLSGGEQQMLAIGRALLSRPRLLLLDEPSMGLAPLMTRKIFEVIRSINENGMTILLVEQNAHLALELSHRAYVMEHGTIILQGAGKELLGNKDVQSAYLGI